MRNDFVKIDRPFVNTGPQDTANTGMMNAMVQMAGSLNLKAIAEIIETEAAARALQEMGCDLGQGYYFSEPIEAELALQRDGKIRHHVEAVTAVQPVENPVHLGFHLRPAARHAFVERLRQGVAETRVIGIVEQEDAFALLVGIGGDAFDAFFADALLQHRFGLGLVGIAPQARV